MGIKKASWNEAWRSDLAGARTQDPLLKREMLYQLSYQIKKFYCGFKGVSYNCGGKCNRLNFKYKTGL